MNPQQLPDLVQRENGKGVPILLQKSVAVSREP